jgi:hypothetical protein
MTPLPLGLLQQQPDPLQQFGRIMALRNALGQQQLQQAQLAGEQQQMAYQQQMQPLELQSKQLDIQTQQRQQQSQQALLRALTENPTANPDDLARAAMGYNAYPADIFPVINQLKESQIKTEQYRGQQLDNQKKVNDFVGDQSEMLLGITDPQQRQQAYTTTTIPGMLQMGVPRNQIPQQVPGDDELHAHALGAVRVDQQLENARKTQEYEQAHGIIDPAKRQVINGLLTNIAQTYGIQPVQLKAGDTWDDYGRIDKLMEHQGKASATQAQRDIANGYRAQAMSLAELAAQTKIEQLNKPTAAEQNRSDLAANALENLETLKDIATRRPELFGPVNGRLTYARGAIGTDDKDIATLHDITDNFGRASQGAHAMRGMAGVASAIDAVTNGFHNSPEATLAAADAATRSLQTFQQQEQAARSGARTGLTPNMVPNTKQRTTPPPPQQQQTAGSVRVGQQVTLNSGKTVTITAVHPDGTFDAR